MPAIFLSNTSNKANPTIVVSAFPANKGLASGIAEELLPAEFMTEVDNIIIPHTGIRRTRPGLTKYSSNIDIGQPVKWIGELWRLNESNTTKIQSNIIATSYGFFSDYNGDQNFTNIGYVDVGEGRVTGDSLVGLMLIGVEGRGLYSYNQSGAVSFLDEQPRASIVRKHRGFFWVSGIEDDVDVVKRSEFETIDFTSDGARTYQLDLNASDPIGNTAIFPEFQGKLYVAKMTSLHELDTSTLQVSTRPISNILGCISHNAVQNVGEDIIFPSIRGLHSLRATANYGDVSDKYISRPVLDLWQDAIDTSRGREISSTFIPEYDSYMMLYPERGHSNKFNLLGWNINSGDFYHWEDYPATFISSHITPVDKLIRMITGDTQGRIAQGNLLSNSSYKDLDNYYSSSFSTPPIFPGQVPNITYKFKKLTVFFKAKTSNIDVTYQVDNKTISNKTLAQSQYSNAGLSIHTFDISGIGHSIKFTFSTTPTVLQENAYLEIVGYTVECEASDSLYRIV